MDGQLGPGQYVIAVSGGVDSVALLHMLLTQPDSRIVESLDSTHTSGLDSNLRDTIPQSHNPTIQLIVAHFDHGMRPESAKDRQFVEDLAKRHGLTFEYAEGRLGEDAGEAQARQARYGFLEKY